MSQIVTGVKIHLIKNRSVEIVKALESFDVTFINGGAALPDLPWPSSIKIVNLPAITSDGEFEALHISDPSQSLERLQAD